MAAMHMALGSFKVALKHRPVHGEIILSELPRRESPTAIIRAFGKPATSAGLMQINNGPGRLVHCAHANSLEEEDVRWLSRPNYL